MKVDDPCRWSEKTEENTMHQESRNSERIKVKPFLRWAGGKCFYIDQIRPHLPDPNSYGYYLEPFLGGGAIFFQLQPDNAILSDLNQGLIQAYIAIRDRPGLIAAYLREFKENDSSVNYYKERAKYNRLSNSYKQAARFIYLNRTCFNGIFRVNRDGEFNVPYGYKDNPIIPTEEYLSKISAILKKAVLESNDYKITLTKARKGDFIYLDPPYPPVNGTSYFTHYTKERFSRDDQLEVFETAEDLSRMGCKVLITNAELPLIVDLYKTWNLIPTETTRYITSSKKKHKVKELLIKNF
jgi:DNA adenine methylase